MAGRRSALSTAIANGEVAEQPVFGSKFRHLSTSATDALTLCHAVADQGIGLWRRRPVCPRCRTAWKKANNG